MIYTPAYIEQSIKDFQKRMETELDFCKELFEDATIRLMAGKYAYYVESEEFMTDTAYDLCEKGWYCMGRALGVLKEDETSPCLDFDPKHPYAQKGIELAERFIKKRKK